MARFEVFFAGLICFIEENDSENQKTAAVLIPENDSHDPWITFGGIPMRLNGDVAFTLPTGPATCQQPFKDTVPKLQKYTVKGTQRKKNAPGFRILLPAGNLTVAAHFDHRALYALNGSEVDQQDVAHLTVLLIDTNKEVINFTIGGQQKQVAVTSFMLIENAAKHQPKPNEHWRLQRQMTTAASDSDIADIVELKQKESSTPASTIHVHEAMTAMHHPTEETALQTQCSNTQWP